MVLCLLRGDFAGAFRQNAAIVSLLPAGLVLVCSRCIYYVKDGSRRPARWENILLWFMIVILVAFGVLRNFIGL